MKTLSFDEMKRVSGAGHFGDVRDANMGKSNKNTGSNNKGNTGYYNNLGQDVTNCNNGIIGGMIAGAPGGVLGLGTGLVGGALAGGSRACAGRGRRAPLSGAAGAPVQLDRGAGRHGPPAGRIA